MTLPSVVSSSVGGDHSVSLLPGNAEELSIRNGKLACRDINPSVARQGVISRQKIVSLALRILLFHLYEISIICINKVLCVLKYSEC